MKYSILSLLLIFGCSSNKQLEAILRSPEKPICQNGKPANGYNLTIMAYNDAEKGTKLEDAKDQTNELTTFYDVFSYTAIPALLLDSQYKISRDKDEHQNLLFRSHSIKYVPESLTEAPETRVWWGDGGDVLSKPLKSVGYGNPWRNTTGPLLIPASQNGDQLIICPNYSCLGLKNPISGEEIIEIDVHPNKALGVKGNLYLEVEGLSNYNSMGSDFFLFDLISKSQTRIGSKFLDSYFVVPKMDQEKICTEMKTWELGYPSGCFETGFKNNEDRLNFNYGNPKFKSTFLSDSGSVACCEKMENGGMECHHGSSSEFACEPNEELNQKYMDAVVRDYIMNKSFTVEKKNSGKWSIYKIKFDPSVMCKYSRDISELTNN